MNKLENKYIDAYHVIFKEGNLNGEWCINDVNAVSKIAANAVNGIVTFTHEQNINAVSYTHLRAHETLS